MYDHSDIEKKWQQHWFNNNVFKTTENINKHKNIYILDMFPYPSGSGLHVGHIEGYTATDVVARFKRLQGFNVLHPIGWDSFGLPAEQYAIETGNHPDLFSKINIHKFRNQLKRMGFSYDYEKEINTSDKNYYKWTQWIFLQFYKKGLAEYKYIDVNWCEKLGTVLANEEIITNKKGNFVSERGNYPVVKKPMKQWVLKITNYACKLVADLDKLNWPRSLILLQKNWIGLKKNSKGKEAMNLRDWVFSRQRFWGEPFPIAFDDKNNVYLIENLPVTLPEGDFTIKPSFNGTSPLSNIKKWVNIEIDGKKVKRETNTMPQWAGSSWYYIAFILKNKNGYIPLNSKEAYEKMKKWLPVDLYIGGQEHAVLHLLYARFWHKVLYDLKIVPTNEPFLKIVNQGMILGTDGHKMSKSRKNGVNPDKIISKYGADSLRIYELFMAAITDDKLWVENGIIAIYKWMNRVYRLFTIEIKKNIKITTNEKILEEEVNTIIKKITKSIENLKFNIAISELMVFVNHIYAVKKINKKIIKTFLILLSPFAPHIAEELLEQYSFAPLSKSTWPTYNENKIINSQKCIIVQTSGKLRGTIPISKNEKYTKEKVLKLSLKLPSVINATKSKKIIKVIYIKNKIINIVIK